MKKLISVLLVMTLLVLSLAACGGSQNSQPAPAQTGSNTPAASDNNSTPAASDSSEVKWQKKTIRIGDDNQAEHSLNVALFKLADIVKEKTGGQVTVDVYPASALGSSADMMSQVMQGTLDATAASVANFGEYDDRCGCADLPYLRDDIRGYMDLYQGDFGAEVASIIDEACDAHVVGYYSIGGFRHVTNNVRAINVPSDMKGIKLRVTTSKIRQTMFESFGASPVAMAFGEVFTSLQQGTIDGQENPLATIYANKFQEVQKYLSLTGHIYSNYAFMFSQTLWDTYQPELQQLLTEAALETQLWQYDQVIADDDLMLQNLKDAGMQVNEVDKDAFREASAPVYDYFAGLGDGAKKLLDLAGVQY